MWGVIQGSKHYSGSVDIIGQEHNPYSFLGKVYSGTEIP